MSNEIREVLPTHLIEAKRTSLARELFTSNFWMSGLAMLRYIPRSSHVKQIEEVAFFTEDKRNEFHNRVLRIAPENPRQWGNDERFPNATSP